MSSNIRVFVQWKNSTVFAGEDIECTITFKNVAPPEGSDRSPVRKLNGFAHGGDRQRKLPPVHSSTRPSLSRNSSFVSQGPYQNSRGHRPALSLSSPLPVHNHHPSSHSSAAHHNGSPTPGGQKHAHGRSLSILSIGTDAATEKSYEAANSPRRPARGHGRSASLQVMPGRPSPLSGTGNLNCLLLLANLLKLAHQGAGLYRRTLPWPEVPSPPRSKATDIPTIRSLLAQLEGHPPTLPRPPRRQCHVFPESRPIPYPIASNSPQRPRPPMGRQLSPRTMIPRSIPVYLRCLKCRKHLLGFPQDYHRNPATKPFRPSLVYFPVRA